MSDRHAQAIRCLQDGSRSFSAGTSSVCGCPADATELSRTFFPKLLVVPCSTHVASGVACSGPLMACGRQWVPPGVRFVGRLLLWRGLACGRRCVCGTLRPGGVGCWMCGLGALVDACGAGGGPSRFPDRCSALRGELLRKGPSAWTNRNAAPIFHVDASAERRCPLRSTSRCHSVHETAAQADVNKSPSAPDHCCAKLRTAEKHSAKHHGQHTA